MQYNYILFDKSGKENTDELIQHVNKYLEDHNISKIVVSSTTGYTAFKALNHWNNQFPIIVCKQDISQEYSMHKDTYDCIAEKCEIIDIPKKYLTNKIGLKATDTLRCFSQGFKVCIELVNYLIDNSKTEENEKLLVIAGTLKGADTALVVNILPQSRYKISHILCYPI